MVLLLFFLIIAFIGHAMDPPSDITTNCRYVSFTSVSNPASGSQVVPIDSCFETSSLEIITNSFAQKAYQFKCDFNNATNTTSPVLYLSNTMDECNNLGEKSDGGIFTIDSYNCDSGLECPFASFHRSTVDDLKFLNCSNITYSQTVVDSVPDSTNIETFTYAMNVCFERSVYTCDANTIYEWMYFDAQCTDYKDMEIVVANSIDCIDQLQSLPAKVIIDECEMTSPPTPEPTTASPTAPTATMSPTTASPTAPTAPTAPTPQPTIYTRPSTSTTEGNAGTILSTMVNLVALLIVCICVIIQ